MLTKQERRLQNESISQLSISKSQFHLFTKNV